MISEGWSIDPIPVVEIEAENEKEAKRLVLLISSRYGHVTDEGLYEFIMTSELDFNELKEEVDLPEIDFKQFEQSYFIEDPQDAEPQIDRAEELNKKWQVKTGDLWQIGEHRLLCGDSTKKEDVERVMGGEKADMVFTDPPYGMNLDADFSDMEGIGKGNKYQNVIGDSEDYDPDHIFRDFGYCKEIFLWGADYYAEKIPNRNEGSWFVWDKTEGGVRTNTAYDKMFGSNFELCWSKQKHKRALARVMWKGIFGLSKEPEHKRFHPTQKPIDLSNWFIEKFSKGNNIITDLFIGVGGVMVACQNLNRKCRGVEISPAYCAVILERMATAFPGIEIKRINGERSRT
jgi:DNA modification methylase